MQTIKYFVQLKSDPDPDTGRSSYWESESSFKTLEDAQSRYNILRSRGVADLRILKRTSITEDILEVVVGDETLLGVCVNVS